MMYVALFLTIWVLCFLWCLNLVSLYSLYNYYTQTERNDLTLSIVGTRISPNKLTLLIYAFQSHVGHMALYCWLAWATRPERPYKHQTLPYLLRGFCFLSSSLRLTHVNLNVRGGMNIMALMWHHIQITEDSTSVPLLALTNQRIDFNLHVNCTILAPAEADECPCKRFLNS